MMIYIAGRCPMILYELYILCCHIFKYKIIFKIYRQYVWGGGMFVFGGGGCWLMDEVSDRDSMQIRLGMSGLTCSKLVLPL